MRERRRYRIGAFLGLVLAAVAGNLSAEYEFVLKFGSFGSAVGQFNEPRGVAVDGAGQIAVADAANARIQVCSGAGVCSAFGNAGVLTGEFDKPRELDFDPVNNEIVIADRGNDRIQFCSTGGSCDSMGGSGIGLGQFESPRGAAVLSASQVVIADTENHRIQICNRAASCTVFGNLGGSPGQFDGPTGVAVNSQGRIIVADRMNNRIQVCTTGGSCTAFGSSGTGPGQFNEPTGIAVDSQDRIVIADRFNHRIQVCSSEGNCTTFGSQGSADGLLDSPWGVAVDASDRIIVSDSGNSRIQVFAESAPAPVTIDSFTASPLIVVAGQPVTLSWSVSNADSCTAQDGTGGWPGMVVDPAGGGTDIVIPTVGSYTFSLQCTGGGASDSASVLVTATEPAPPFVINAGITDAWFYPATAGQGFFIIVWEEQQTMFLAWFTYDAARPAEDVTAILGEPGHRWITAQGPYLGDTATLEINVTSGGIFDSNELPVETVSDGVMTVQFSNCREGLISYQIDSAGLNGTVPIERIVLDGVPLCEALVP